MNDRPEPVAFGQPTPPGRRVGDCWLCSGDDAPCDCQLRYTTTPGMVIVPRGRARDQRRGSSGTKGQQVQ